MSDDSLEIEVEKHSLLPDRYYLILRPSEDGFAAIVYDTTEGTTDEDGYPHPGEVAIEGLLALLNIEPERIFTAGMVAIETRERFGTHPESDLQESDNVIKVDFGPKQ
jgi:hypothetical protein